MILKPHYGINSSTKIKTYKLSETQYKRSKDKQKLVAIIKISLY